MKRINYLMLACLLLGGLSLSNVQAMDSASDATVPMATPVAGQVVVTPVNTDQVAAPVVADIVTVPVVTPVVPANADPAAVVTGSVDQVMAPVDATASVEASAEEEVVVPGNKRGRDAMETETDKADAEKEAPVAKESCTTLVVAASALESVVGPSVDTVRRLLDEVVDAMNLTTPVQRDAAARNLEANARAVVADIENPAPSKASEAPSKTGLTSDVAVCTPSRLRLLKDSVVGHLRSTGDLISTSACTFGRGVCSAGSTLKSVVSNIYVRFGAYTGLAAILSQLLIARNNARSGAEWQIGLLDREAFGLRTFSFVSIAVSAELVYAVVRYVCAKLRTQPQ